MRETPGLWRFHLRGNRGHLPYETLDSAEQKCNQGEYKGRGQLLCGTALALRNGGRKTVEPVWEVKALIRAIPHRK